jgi:hypothetical protein
VRNDPDTGLEAELFCPRMLAQSVVRMLGSEGHRFRSSPGLVMIQVGVLGVLGDACGVGSTV